MVKGEFRPMKVDIMFLVNHFRQVGEGFYFIFHYFLYTKSSELACDAKLPTPYESEFDRGVFRSTVSTGHLICEEQMR